MKRKRFSGLKPIVDDKTEVLILGSFPGQASLDKNEYYVNKSNQFWKIMSNLFNDENFLGDCKGKTGLLLKKKIGLWDVIKSCYREGSSDNEITGEKLNDINSFLKKYPKIKAIFFNGRKAEKIFRRNYISSVHLEYLPSTSPANKKYSYCDKKKCWAKILQLIK